MTIASAATAAVLLRRSIISRAASSSSSRHLHRATLSLTTSFSCHHNPNSSFSTSPDYANSYYETSSWQHADNNTDSGINGSSHAVINLATSNKNDTPSPSSSTSPIEGPRTSVLMELPDRVGALHDVLKYYWKYDVNITRIESRPVTAAGSSGGSPKFDFFVDFHGKVGDPNVNALLQSLKQLTDKLLVLDEKEVHWFPRHISELDLIANRTLDAGEELTSDHPGFNDGEYRARRARLADAAVRYRMHHDGIPMTEYTQDEIDTWGLVWDTMEGLWDKYACKEYKVRL
jgi:hypothetical protein